MRECRWGRTSVHLKPLNRAPKLQAATWSGNTYHDPQVLLASSRKLPQSDLRNANGQLKRKIMRTMIMQPASCTLD
eukprot:6373259-Amphidinium_carterae.1